MTVILRQAPQNWECPNCPVTDRTVGLSNRFHRCGGLAGLLAPLVPQGSRSRVSAHEREDYTRGEDVPTDGNGRPVSSVVTTRSDGSNDVLAFAPTAYVRGEA